MAKPSQVFSAEAVRLRSEGRMLLDPGCLLFAQLRAEHRERFVVAYGVTCRNLLFSLSQKTLMLCVHQLCDSLAAATVTDIEM